MAATATWDARYVSDHSFHHLSLNFLFLFLRFLYESFLLFANLSSYYRYLDPNAPHNIAYYSKAMLGGALACGVTHAGITPLDVTKCNMQVNYTSSSTLRYSIFILHRSVSLGSLIAIISFIIPFRSTPQNTRDSPPV